MEGCVTDTARALSCRDGQAAAHLKLISIFAITITSVVGISTPVLLARVFQGKPVYDKVVLLIKCFAAGVILSTSLVHVLPDAFAAFSDCQLSSHHPWKDFPFTGLVTMIGALLALFVDVAATSHVDHQPNYNPVPVVANEELPVVAKNAIEYRVETGALAPSCHQRGDDELVKLKQRLVSQVLEIGIIFQ